MSKRLTEENYQDAADALGVEVAAIKAVSEVEAPRGGFLPDGRPTILFERHKFSKYTGGKYDASHPGISSKKRGGYIGGAGEWKRMDEAVGLNTEAAYKSASWGKYQIMGGNFAACGFTNVFDFVDAMERDEAAQLKAFVAFIKSNRLDDELRNHKWADFAASYNGAAYRENHYDTKMAAAYKKYKAASSLERVAGNDIQQPNLPASPLAAGLPPAEESAAPTQQADTGSAAAQVNVGTQTVLPPVVKNALEGVTEIASTGLGQVGKKITWGAIIGGGASALWGALQANWIPLLVGFLFAIFLIGGGLALFALAYHWGQKKKVAEAQIRSDPQRFNVSFEK